jgi:ribonuclease VapC
VVVDTSAILALIQNEEPYAAQVAAALAGARDPIMSAPTATECLIVLTVRHGPVGRTIFERLRTEVGLRITDFTDEHAAAAHRAFLHYGKGRHSAALNFGDCMSYAAAEVAHRALLAVGDDFSRTDLEFGGGVVGDWPARNA